MNGQLVLLRGSSHAFGSIPRSAEDRFLLDAPGERGSELCNFREGWYFHVFLGALKRPVNFDGLHWLSVLTYRPRWQRIRRTMQLISI